MQTLDGILRWREVQMISESSVSNSFSNMIPQLMCKSGSLHLCLLLCCMYIKLLESPIPAAAAAAAPAAPSQKAHCDNISGTKRGTIDPLVSKRPEKNSE